jgi:hypothetical protein
MQKWGVRSTNTNSEATAPTILLYATIANCSSAGIYVTAGSVTVNLGSIDHNFIGVDMESDGFDAPTVTLNDGTMTNNTTVICNSNQENGSATPGMDVYNNSTGALVADYVNWDDWYQPNGDAMAAMSTDIFFCGPDTTTCTCGVMDSSGDAGCVNTPGGDDMDLVLGGTTDTTPSGTQSSTNGALSPNACK